MIRLLVLQQWYGLSDPEVFSDNWKLRVSRSSVVSSKMRPSSPRTPRGVNPARTRRSHDGTWAKKGSKSQFWYKLHTLIGKDWQLISQIDLSRIGEMIYCDKGCFGMKPRASIDKTMRGAVRGRPFRSRKAGGIKASAERDS